MYDNEQERRRKYYRDWYAKNKVKFNAKRRQRYKTDTEYRDKAIQQARDYRSYGPTPAKDSATVLDGGVVKFRIGYVAELLDVQPQAIRQWEYKGYIPVVEGKHRYYTQHQIVLMKRLVALRKKKGVTDELLESTVNYIFDNWEG